MDPKTSLKPAYSEGKFSVEQLSSEDFHRKLYEFFEDRGLVTDLRSHLRTKMINVLKETPIGRSDCKRSMSPKMQAINLLLAEFLIQQNCFYSLSVFSTEVPLANILPELTNNFVRKPEAGWKFEEKDASDILETLGFDATILNSYFDPQNTESLLCCILKALPRNFKPTTAFTENHENIEEILKASHLPPSTIEQITQEITQIKDDIIKEQKEEYEKLIEKHSKIALTQTKNDYDEKTIEEYKQIWQNKNDALKLKEKQLQEKEKQLQEKERELQKRTTQFNDIQTKNEDELVMLKRKIEELREENIRLENMNGQQRRNTEKLKLNARLLSSELSAARTQRRMRVNNNSQVNKAVSLSGEGEQVPLLPQPHHFMGRHKNGFFCSSSDETPHIDVLEETRERLNRLQQENDRIEKRISVSFNQQKKYLQPSSSDSEAASTSQTNSSASVNVENKKTLED